MQNTLLFLLMIASLALNGSSNSKLRAYYHKTSGAMIAAELIKLSTQNQIEQYHTQGLKIIACLQCNDYDKNKYQLGHIVDSNDFNRELKPLHPQDVVNLYQEYNTINQVAEKHTKMNFYDMPWTGNTLWHAAVNRQTGKVIDHTRAKNSQEYMHITLTKEDHTNLKAYNYQLIPHELIVALF